MNIRHLVVPIALLSAIAATAGEPTFTPAKPGDLPKEFFLVLDKASCKLHPDVQPDVLGTVQSTLEALPGRKGDELKLVLNFKSFKERGAFGMMGGTKATAEVEATVLDKAGKVIWTGIAEVRALNKDFGSFTDNALSIIGKKTVTELRKALSF